MDGGSVAGPKWLGDTTLQVSATAGTAEANTLSTAAKAQLDSKQFIKFVVPAKVTNPASAGGVITGHAVSTLLNMITNDPDRIEQFQTSNILGLSELLKANDKIQFVVTIYENANQNNLDGTPITTQQTSKMLVRINVTDPV